MITFTIFFTSFHFFLKTASYTCVKFSLENFYNVFTLKFFLSFFFFFFITDSYTCIKLNLYTTAINTCGLVNLNLT